jgi:hypothetical protein
MADSSNAGLVAAMSMKGRASTGMSAHLRKSRTRRPMFCRYASTVSRVSTSMANRFGTPPTGLVRPPPRSWPKTLESECTGLSEAIRVLRPWLAKCSAMAADITVLPTPPFPPK